MAEHPNVIYIISDEHCGSVMSHLDDANVRTPNMDRMAGQGVSFGQAYANCPICTPSRGTIFSGRHAHCGPVTYFFDVYKATAPSTATILQQAGYHTAYFGKWHCGIVRDQRSPEVADHPERYGGASSRTPEHHRAGFQDWYGFEVINRPFESYYYHEREASPRKMEGYQTDWLTDLACDYISDHDRAEPLFMVLSVEPPHFALEAPEAFKRFDPDALVTPPNFDDSPEMRELLAIYLAMVENLDWNIGRLLDHIAATPGFADNTLVVYTADHGEYMGAHGAIRRKENPHQESVRIPALFSWPGHIASQPPRDDLFSLVDLLPTTLGLLGLDIPPHVQGTDFSPALRGEPFHGPQEVLLEMSGNPRWNLDFLDWRALVTDEFKYAFYETGHEWLFDLREDPYELRNLVDERPEVRDRLRQRLLELLADTREPYFDVLIEHGAPMVTPIGDVSGYDPFIHGALAPHWDDIERL